ncbi:magnesium chelatase subunit D [Parasphingorhabdus cellanae]|uniref:Magnesium chelatase subunit D n=1 Tax=Parasphingorhabdus cellanae TaxID=2806553 RepID=A0ABX7T9W6_9SPHN|nr:magnesium chelatase subunit D [Parasphingorhabdus cellanae]QTD57374.1 magnesium chelatase subunit D [Parasphingorhabdus cellanae]
MKSRPDSGTALADHLLAARLFSCNPSSFGGICLRGTGPVRDALVAALQAALSSQKPVIKIPINVDADRLLGGVDLTATLEIGRTVRRDGLLDQMAQGVVIIPMGERMTDDIAAHIAQAMDITNLAVILLDDSPDADEVPPSVLLERMAFHCDLSAARDLKCTFQAGSFVANAKIKPLRKKQRSAIAATASALGVYSIRPLVFAERAARYHAAIAGRSVTSDADIEAAIRLVLAPLATQIPDFEKPSAEPPKQNSENQSEDRSDSDEDKQMPADIPFEDILLEAAAAAIPPKILDQIKGKDRLTGKGQAGRSGQKQKSAKRGRPRGSRPGVPGNGKKLALIDSLRAAAPWQNIRRLDAKADDQRIVHVRKSDLRVRHFEEQRETLTIFAVDASGSSALSRLAEAKGAIELMLAEAYIKRSQVALIAFRQTDASILLPPTRSLTRARRALTALPGGGGTPIAAGLIAAQRLADAAVKHGQTPTIALLTDGKANVMLDGTANRKGANEEMLAAAKAIAVSGIQSIVIDISPRPRPEAAELAETLRGRYLPLPRAGSKALVEAIETVGAEG